MADPIRIRAELEGDFVNIGLKISHVMETGQRKDARTGELVPAYFIQTIVVALNGKTVLDAQLSQSISKNPFLRIHVRGARAGDKVAVNWVDSKGMKGSGEAVVTARQ